MLPQLSIIIVNWKSARFLGPCLDSIYAGRGDFVLEVIVVDNASYDGCDTMLADQYPQVRFIQSPVNLGFAGANNLAFRQSCGETILFLNPDTEIVGQALSTMHRLLWETPDAGAIGCTLLNSDGTIQTSCIQAFPTILNQVLDAEALQRFPPMLSLWGTQPLFEQRENPMPVEVVSGACLMVKRHVFESAGFFSTDYFMYLEDTDLCCNIRLAGFVVYYTGAASVVHHGGGSSKQRERSYFSDVVMCESMSRFLRKFRGGLYGNVYRVAMCGVACFRVMLMVSLLTVTLRKSARDAFRISLGKWVKILRWSLGCEGWARRLTPELPLVHRTECVMPESEYVLITAAYNEGAHIGATIEAVLSQTVTPRKWVIISDGSTDNTDAIIKQYAERSNFIEYIRREKTGTLPGFISKVCAIHTGFKVLSGMSYRFIGILDADITFGKDYYERVISKLHEDTRLGIAGGFIYEPRGDVFRSRPSNTRTSVAGAIQLFRRECYEAIGGHVPLPYGGEDWMCEIMTRMKGLEVKAFPDIVAFHHNPSEAKRGAIKNAIRQGKMDYSVGSHPLFELAKCVRRVQERPFFLRALFRFLGFTWSAIKRDRIEVSAEVIGYLRREQMNKLRILNHAPRR